MQRVVLVIAASLLLCSSAAAQRLESVVVTSDAYIFVTPSVRRDALTAVEAAVVLKAIQVEGDWYLIEYKHARWGSRRGYIHKDHVKPVFRDLVAARPTSPQPIPTAPSSAPAPRARRNVEPPPASARPAQPVGPAVKLNGYLEWHRADHIVVDGQRARWNGRTRLKLRGTPSVGSVPLGSEVQVEGNRLEGGSVLARTLETKPNGIAMFETEVRTFSNTAETTFIQQGAFLQAAPGGRFRSLGAIIRSGPEVDRCRAIVNRLVPPTTTQSEIRVYVIDSPEWNAMMMANGAMWVFSGLLREMDDDEVAAVIGHELAHYTHEHIRRGQKRAYWGQLLGAVADGITSQMNNIAAADAAQLGAFFALNAWVNGYSRDQEDQADRVGLRYAHEAGFNVHRGARIWQRFGARYGQGDRFANFFFGGHSLAAARLRNLQGEIRYNYADTAASVDS